MGDIADWTNDTIQEANPGWFPLGRGRRYQQRLPECKFCGRGGLQWEDDNGKWVLIDGHGKVHNCRNKPASVDEFEELG